ncbi:protein with spectrin repeats [Cryptosporidium ryanae]|uniref:protein with spectrin repeats n=1 Tax=Cryptosporidium ryanae TaxID=515981 RepID=UPI00351A5BBF|nr:protein with spectrin repeats [Cryptosporidium ryanae]
MIGNRKLERAIEIGVERLRKSLYEKECEIKERLLELKESELRIKNRESSVEESLRILEQEKKNVEYMRIVNDKTEKMFNSAMNSLKSKEKFLEEGLNSIVDEFGILDGNGKSAGRQDMDGKIESIKSYIRRTKRNEADILKYAKIQQIEKIGSSTNLCKCGFPIFSVNDEMIVARSKKGNESELVELEFRYMELEWERKAIEHTRNTLRQEKLRQEEIIQSKEERLRHKNNELENRLREVKRMEHILRKNMSSLNKNVRLKRSSLPNNFEKYTSDLEDGYCTAGVAGAKREHNRKASAGRIVEMHKHSDSENFGTGNNVSISNKIRDLEEKLNSGIQISDKEDASSSNNRCSIENAIELTPEQNKHKINITYPSSRKLNLTTRMSPLLKSQRQRLKHILYEEELCSEDASDGLKPNIGVDSLNGDLSSSRACLRSGVSVSNGIDALKVTTEGEMINDKTPQYNKISSPI